MNETRRCLADLHIHVGVSESGRWIKIPSTRRLTVHNIMETACRHKGLDAIGIIDALSPLVQEDLRNMLSAGLLREQAGGGYIYRDKLAVVLGGEVETGEISGGAAHSLLFLPTLDALQELSRELSVYIKNINMSSQNAHMGVQELYDLAIRHKCKVIPAHVFTPFKSIYGNCARRLEDLFAGGLPPISAVELGLSADSYMADRISELHSFSYLANSDAHSLENIGREFTDLEICGEPSFESIFAAIAGKKGCVKALYGLNPALGKYHLTRCADCAQPAGYNEKKCGHCGGRVVRGVSERIDEIADRPLVAGKALKAPYIYHLPLSFLPGIGRKALEKIYTANYNELEILYKIDLSKINALLGEKAANSIGRARRGDMELVAGGAGHYGRVLVD